MTKEAILEKLQKENPSSIPVFKAMDEWAQLQAIAFANHIAYNGFKPHDIDTWNDGKHNTHELYDDFLQHQLIEKQIRN